MSGLDDVARSVEVERYARRPVDHLARVVRVGRVPWSHVYGEPTDVPTWDDSPDLVAARRAELLAATPPDDPETAHAARLLVGVTRTPKEPR